MLNEESSSPRSVACVTSERQTIFFVRCGIGVKIRRRVDLSSVPVRFLGALHKSGVNIDRFCSDCLRWSGHPGPY